MSLHHIIYVYNLNKADIILIINHIIENKIKF
jgi:hypothetical protein